MAARRRKSSSDPNDNTKERLARVEERQEGVEKRMDGVEKRQEDHFETLRADIRGVLKKVDWLTVEATKAKLKETLPGLPVEEEGSIVIPAKTVRTVGSLVKQHKWSALVALGMGSLPIAVQKLVKLIWG